MKLFPLYVSQKEALSSAHRMKLFLSYSWQNEAVSVIPLTEWSSFCLTAYRMKRFWYVSWNEVFKLLGTTCPTTQCHLPEDWNFMISFVIAGQSYFLYI